MSAPNGKRSPAYSEQARELAASLDAVADDLERNGAVPSSEVRRTLLALYAELNEEKAAG